MTQRGQTIDVDKKSKISTYFDQWVEGLSAALLWASARISRRRHFQIRNNLRRLSLLLKDGPVAQPVFSKDIGVSERIPEAVLETTRNCTIEIIVPEAAVIERQLDPLPAESQPYIENVILHQIESIFPWRSADILYSTGIEKRIDGMLDIRVRATSRAAIKAELALAQETKADEVFVTTDNAQGTILAFIGADREMRLNKARFVARYAAISVLIFGICMVGWTTFERQSLASDVAALNDTIAGRQALLKKSANIAGLESGRGLGEKKSQTTPAVGVLEELSSILPESTYLTDLSLDGLRLRITGISTNAVDLPVLLENSGRFKNVSFYAPTTRISNGASDRFSIEASVAPRQGTLRD